MPRAFCCSTVWRAPARGRLLTLEAARLLALLGADTRPRGCRSRTTPPNAVNQMRILGRWMRMLTIPNQSSVPKAFLEFNDDDRMKPSALYDRVVDVMEELVKFTLLTRDMAPHLVDRYSERKESPTALSARVNQRSL